jgi:CRP-like cAMP-binding protein
MIDGSYYLLEGLAAEDAEQMLALGSRLTVASGAELFHLGTVAESLFVIVRGRIKLTLPMQVRGKDEDVLVEERGPGQAVGWSALIPPYRFTLTASAPLETEVIVFSREALRRHFTAHPQVGYMVSLNLAAVVGHRLQLFQAMWLREMQRVVELRCA